MASDPAGDGGAAATPQLVYVIGRVNQGVLREMRVRLARFALSVPEYTVLSVLGVQPGLSNAQLSRRSMVTPQSMMHTLAALEQRELVRRDVDPDHGRILRTELTPGGRQLQARVEPVIGAMQEQLLAGLAPEQRETLLVGLLGAMGNLTAGLAPDGPA